MKTLHRITAAIALVAFTSCSSLTNAYNSPTNQAFLKELKAQVEILGPIAVQLIANYLMQGGNISNLQGLQAGAYAATEEAQHLIAAGASQDYVVKTIADTVTASSGDPKLKPIAQNLVKRAIINLPENPTPPQVAAATSGVGNALGDAIAKSPNG